VFSGRLIRMKGADHLPLVAAELNRRQIPFEMTICGDGVLADSMRQQIASLGLSSCVRMPGVLDFATELVPFVKRKDDVFVCCHRQGDPSCTYIETMSCGVPIVGYENEALGGMLRRVPAGIGVPMDDVAALADALARLHADRATLAAMSRRALEFAAENTFEETVRKRMEHLRGLLMQASGQTEIASRH
jgi:glycosyltransferase involved in cell wall biosynthesis